MSSSSPVFAVDASSGGKVRLLATANKLQVRASELESKLDTLNTTCSNINVSVGDVTVNTADLETLQSAANISLASVDGKITACNTGAVVVSSSALPSGGATSINQGLTNTILSTVDGKITACDTGAVVVSSTALAALAATSTLQTAGNATLALVNGKMTACDTGAVVVSSTALASLAATSTLQTDGNESLADILTELQTPTALASENTLQDVDSSVQSLVTPLDDILLETQSNGTKLDDIVTNTAASGGSPSRSISTLASAQSVADGVDIGSHNAGENIDMSSHKTLVISGSTSVSGSIEMYVSNDGGTTFIYAEQFYSESNYAGSTNSWYKVMEHASGMVKFKWVGGSTTTITFQADKQNW